MRREVLIWVALLASGGSYAAACILPALGPPFAEGAPDMVKAMTGAECFAMGLLYFIFALPLLLWMPNALIGWLWYRVIANVTTSWRALAFVPGATVVSTVACCTLYPYRPLVGAWLWVTASVLAVGAAWAASLPDPTRQLG